MCGIPPLCPELVEYLNAHWFRTLQDVRRTLEDWRKEYNCERPHSGLDYLTPEEFRQRAGGNVENALRFPRSHRLDGGCELGSEPNQNREQVTRI